MSGSVAAVAHAVAPLRPVSLDEVLERAALQTRADTKFIVYPAVFDRLLALLGPRLDVLGEVRQSCRTAGRQPPGSSCRR
jgi:hypothetical protein